jgi:NAD+ kinase
MVRIGLVLHPRRDSSAAVRQVENWTRTHGVELVAAEDDVLRLGVDGVVPVEVEELARTCDGMIALGGDGTLLGAMRLVSGRPVPVLGVNLGRLGFLAAVEGTELEQALTALAEGRGSTEERPCLVVRHGETESLAFNDVVLARVPGEGMVEANLSVGGRRYGHYRCDALIVATPMGSTAYAYAAGGPVVSPGVEGILVTPSAPLSGISHSVLLGPGEPLRLELTTGRPAFELDGVLTGRVHPGEVLDVVLRPAAGLLVRIDGTAADVRSRVKLSLLDLPLLPQELLELVPEGMRPRTEQATEPG